MRCLLLTAVLLAYAVAALPRTLQKFDAPTTAPPAASGHWTDLFQPPYTNVPKVTMAISCITGQHCYLPGGTNENGFDMFLFDGHHDGRFTPLNMPDKALLMMAIGMGGTDKDPKGVAGGFGIGNGLQYAKNATTFDPSFVPTLFVETQDIRTSADGMNSIAVIDSHVLYSGDAGVTFSEKKISDIGKCAFGRYGAMISANEWYITLGSWPENNNKVAGEKKLSERVSIVNGKRVSKKFLNKDGSIKRHGHSAPGCGYTAIIAHTTDGGNTFTNVFDETNVNTTDFYFNGIDCSSATNCVAVGEGFNANPAGHVWHTTDGKTWTEVLKLPSGSSGMYSLMSVRFKTSTEVWIAGSKEGSFTSQAVFMRSTDGGKTWVDESGTLNNIGDISMVSFTADGEHGYATAVTVYDDSTILRYGAKLPPAPPAPPTPAPQGVFTQSDCPTSACDQANCQNHTFQAGQCLQLNGGGSALATCSPTHLIQVIFNETNFCQGPNQTTKLPLQTCLKSEAGGYFENFCPNETPLPPTPAPPPTPMPPVTPAPPTPAPATVTQKKCTNSNCTEGCESNQFQTGVCLKAGSSQSAVLQCTPFALLETVYQTADCSGQSQSGEAPLDTCSQAQGGGYLENSCSTSQIENFQSGRYSPIRKVMLTQKKM